MQKNKGWVKLWREQFSHEISDRKPWCDGYAWSNLYARANYKAGVVNFRNQYIPVERGQFITSVLKLHERFGWSRRRVNSFLTSLESRGMCDIRRSNRFIVITICNYEKFQSTEDANETTDETTDVTTDAQQMHTNKKYKERKEVFPCPHQTIVDIYHTVLPELHPVKVWSEERKKDLRARWVEEAKRQDLDWWKRYFEYVRESSFLMGNEKEKWQPNLEWLVKKKNLINVIEGLYHKKS
jgi:hypothetical protein